MAQRRKDATGAQGPNTVPSPARHKRQRRDFDPARDDPFVQAFLQDGTVPTLAAPGVSKPAPADRERKAAEERKLSSRITRTLSPETPDDYQYAFADIGVRSAVFDQLRDWTQKPRDWEPILRLLRRLHTSIDEREAELQIAADVHGKARRADRLGTRGELERTREAVNC